MIILGRHGNTFEPGMKAVWVGARSDLPLTAEGRAQAIRVACHLKRVELAPRTIVAGPLRRTREFAEIVASFFGPRVEIDDSLRELDYGGWEGLDNASVTDKFGVAALAGWEEDMAWPGPSSAWGESPDIVRARVQAAMDRLSTGKQPAFACTSNGILRFVWALTQGLVDLPASKVKTGAICRLNIASDGFEVVEWNYLP